MRWAPVTSFFQVLVDMKNAANVVPGVFAAKGHDYRADLLPFFHAVLGLDATPEQLASVAQRLADRELFRSEWMKKHGTADKSLAAAVLARLIHEEREAGRDADERLVRLVRAVALEEFDAERGRRSFVTRVRRAVAAELAAIGCVAVYSIVVTRIRRRARLRRISERRSRSQPSPRMSGASPSELGLSRANVGRGTRIGLIAAAPLAAASAGAVAIPRTRRLLIDERITGASPTEAVFETLVRIPLETALAEEVIFRGVLLALGLRSRSRGWAVVTSSMLFGLWHVVPALSPLARGASGRPNARATAPTAAVVAATAIAGAGLRVATTPRRQRGRSQPCPRRAQHGGLRGRPGDQRDRFTPPPHRRKIPLGRRRASAIVPRCPRSTSTDGSPMSTTPCGRTPSRLPSSTRR